MISETTLEDLRAVARGKRIHGQVPCSGVAVCAFGSVFSSVFEVRRLAGCGHHWRLLCGA